jgi:hypothetical protein
VRTPIVADGDNHIHNRIRDRVSVLGEEAVGTPRERKSKRGPRRPDEPAPVVFSPTVTRNGNPAI